MSSILVLAETFGGKIRKPALSAITFARQYAGKVGGDFSIALLGSGIAGLAQELTGYGAKAVHVVDTPALANYLAGPWAKAVADLANQVGADYVAATSDTFSRDLLPRVAARLNAGMVSDVTGIAGDKQFYRPMWAGNVLATVEVRTQKAVFAVRGTDFEPPVASGGGSPVQTATLTVQDNGRAKFVNFVPTVSARPDLAEAPVVISGGRGLRDKAGFALLDPLADILKAAIGATRAVVDSGVCPNDLQVGQTGKVVAPQLYFAIGLSGAIQHVAGMKNSKVIVAINKDPEAPIFAVADYGLVGDAFKILPELTEEIRKIKG
jgi:electron transfer flavoprotein alpha subunit